MNIKPDAPACARNRDPILEVLRPALANAHSVLEIGSGTGQHAIYFAAALPHLLWQTSDCPAHLPGIQSWLDETALDNTLPPLALDVTGVWPSQRYDAIFSANTLHIMHWPSVVQMFAPLPQVLNANGQLIIYGPFNYGDQYTSESNRQFDQWLKSRDAGSSIRDFEAVDLLAQAAGLQLTADHEMPANNRCLVWQRS